MAFTVRDYRDLLQLLAEHPDWREELRRALLSDDFLALPQIVRELTEAQKRSEERLTRLEQTVAELAEAQKRTEQQIRKLIEIQKQHVERLANVEERLTNVEGRLANVEERLTNVEGRLTNVEENLEKLTTRVDRMDIRLAKVDGRTLELEYERKAGGFFGRIISNPQVVNLGEWQDRLKPAFSGEEISDVWLADLILRGSLRKTSQEQPKREAWLVIEISVLVDAEDVERAVRRAELLRKADILALPVVAGEEITDRAIQMVEGNGVIFVKDGSIRLLEQALVRYG